jgi:hypothetical protein
MSACTRKYLFIIISLQKNFISCPNPFKIPANGFSGILVDSVAPYPVSKYITKIYNTEICGLSSMSYIIFAANEGYKGSYISYSI